jgi:hypothetical protein
MNHNEITTGLRAMLKAANDGYSIPHSLPKNMRIATVLHAAIEAIEKTAPPQKDKGYSSNTRNWPKVPAKIPAPVMSLYWQTIVRYQELSWSMCHRDALSQLEQECQKKYDLLTDLIPTIGNIAVMYIRLSSRYYMALRTDSAALCYAPIVIKEIESIIEIDNYACGDNIVRTDDISQ